MADKYLALYRKWRPKTFDEIVGQEHITTTLKNELASGKIGHAYLFCGTRGTGKTSTAKIFARAVNCENPKFGEPCNECDTCRAILSGRIMDVYEMDAASNNGVDAVRELREEVIYTPSGCKYKVYIIDEVHMLTIQAFNALLKTLEEPPEHALFILATTEPHKIPRTILSRCQRYDFKRIDTDDIAKRLKKVAAAENIDATEDALELIAELGDGSMRDALSVLDRCSAFDGQLRRADVADIIGVVNEKALFEIADAAADGSGAEMISKLDALLNTGKEVSVFFEDMISHFRALLLSKECGDDAALAEILEKPTELVRKYAEQAKKFSAERLIYAVTTLGDYHNRARAMSMPRVAAETALIKIMRPEYGGELEALATRIEKLENIIRSGGGVVPTADSGRSVRGDAPIAARNKKSEPKPAGVSVSGSSSDGTWTLWPEVLDNIKSNSKSLYMYLYKARVTKNGDTIVIHLENEYYYNKVATPKGKEYLSSLFSSMAKEPLRAEVLLGDGDAERKPNTQGSIMDIVNKKEQFGDIIKVKGDL